MHKTFKEANSTNINYFYWDCKLFYKWVCNILWHLQHIGYYNLIKLNCECFKRQFWFSFFAVEGKKLARSEILSNQCLELDVQQRKRFCGGAEIWQSDNFRSAQFDVFCNWNAPPSFVAFYDFCLQSLVSSSALYVNSSITLSKCSSSSKWEFCFKSKLSGHLIVSTMFQLTKWSELPFRMITRSWQEAEKFSSSSSPAAL